MATAILKVSDRFPQGTTVNAYPASQFPSGNGAWTGALPGGASSAGSAAVAADGSLTITGLSANTAYLAYANVSSQDRYVLFSPAVSSADRSTATTSNAVSVGTGSTVVAGNNPNRREITVTNDGANIVYLQTSLTGTAPTAVASQGIRLTATGGSWTTQNYTGPIAGIALTGATVVTVTEF